MIDWRHGCGVASNALPADQKPNAAINLKRDRTDGTLILSARIDRATTLGHSMSVASFAESPSRLGTCTIDEAAQEMELLDNDFHLFTEKGTGRASVLYRTDSAGYRMAQVMPLPGNSRRTSCRRASARNRLLDSPIGRAKERLSLLTAAVPVLCRCGPRSSGRAVSPLRRSLRTDLACRLTEGRNDYHAFSDCLPRNECCRALIERVEATPDKEAFRYQRGGEWTSVTWRDTAARVELLAAGLLALGIEPEQRVGIASSTRYEWILADLAIMSAGAATTTVYANTNAADTAFILADSESRIVFAEDAEQLAKLTARRADLPALTKVVTFDGTADGDWVLTLDELAELGEKYLADQPECVRRTVAAIAPERLATLIYTSGTTGRPKGVRLDHKAWVYEGAAVAALDVIGEDDLQLLWLPLAHSFGKVLLAAQLACGFVSAVDGRIDKIVENAAAVKPTFMAAAPRILRKGARTHRPHNTAGRRDQGEAFRERLRTGPRRGPAPAGG